MPRLRTRSASSRRPRAGAAPAADVSRDAWAIVIQFMKAAKQRFLAEFDLTPAQAQLLMQLDPERPMPMIEVANGLGCDASNVTGLVDRLEERGVIERRSASTDRRVKMVAVTPAGEKLRGKVLERWYGAPPPVAALPQRDQKELLRILRKAAGD
jgi:DNA-binding MarR family transcriptional regulator